LNIRIFGPPGTGKTHSLKQVFGHLIGRVDATEWLDEYNLDLPNGKYSPRDVVLMSFTNSAVDELVDRVDLSRGYRTGLYGTMHGVALHLLIDDKAISQSIVSKTLRKPGAVSWWKLKFAREVGIPYDPNEELTVLLGNQFFNEYTRAVNEYFPQYQSLARVVDRMIAENDVFGQLAEDWLKFKKRERVIDFDDVLALTLISDVHPDRPVLIADEFQDFSPLQWEIFKNWMVDTEYVIVAGDDDQTLFSFQAASPDFLLHKFPADDSIVLKRSFRLPSQILTASQVLVKTFVKNRYPKKFLPRKKGGKVLFRDIPFYSIPKNAYYLAQRGVSVMVLARTNSQVRDIEEMFLTQGVPYYRFKTRRMQLWKDVVDRVEDLIRLLKQGKRPTKSDIRFYLRLCGMDGPSLEKAVDVIHDNPRNLLVQKILSDPVGIIRTEALAKELGSDSAARLAKEALHARLSGRMERPAAPIYIDTIHAAKGREADVVIIYDGITPRIISEIEDGGRDEFEAEVRVWYVALTRARESVIISRGPRPFLTPRLAQALYVLKEKARVVQ